MDRPLDAPTVVVKTRDPDAVMQWCVNSLKNEKPIFTRRDLPNGEYLLRATFLSGDNATLFKLFWHK